MSLINRYVCKPSFGAVILAFYALSLVLMDATSPASHAGIDRQ